MSNISSEKILHKSSDDEISQASQALLKLLIDSRKLRLSEKDFHSQMTTQAGMNDDQIQLLWQFLSNESALDELITSDEYKFRDLEWRLEAKVRDVRTSEAFTQFLCSQVASRFSHSLPPEPKIVMKFHLDREKSFKHRLTLTENELERSKMELVIETDTNSLVHIIDQLESARTAVIIKRTSQLPSK